MESHRHQEHQNDETPTKTLDITDEDSSPLSPPSVPSTQQMPLVDAGCGGSEDPRDAKPPSSEISDLEKKQRRAERFGLPVQLSEVEKRSSRAERFGTVSASSGKSDVGKLDEDKRSGRAERFGLIGQAPNDEEAKKKARLDRFAMNPVKVTVEEEEKRKARALRFSGTSSVAAETNGKGSPELEDAAVVETKQEA